MVAMVAVVATVPVSNAVTSGVKKDVNEPAEKVVTLLLLLAQLTHSHTHKRQKADLLKPSHFL